MYIDAEEKGLRETLETLVREESWKPMEDAAQTNVLRSASELFAVIKKSLQRCSRFVSRGEPMLRLMGAFQARPVPSCKKSAAFASEHFVEGQFLGMLMASETDLIIQTACKAQL